MISVRLHIVMLTAGIICCLCTGNTFSVVAQNTSTICCRIGEWRSVGFRMKYFLSLCILMNKNEITKSITFVLENLLHFVEELRHAGGGGEGAVTG